MTVNISVGTVLSVSLGAPTTYDQAGFEAKSYTAVGEVTDLPQFGGTATVTEHTPLATGIIDKLVGSINYGDMEVPMASVWGDAGQAALKSGFDGANSRQVHSFKVANPEVGTVYFTAKISGVQYTPGDANAVYNNSASLALTNRVIEVAATDTFVVTYLAGANGSIIGDSVQYVADGGDSTPVFASAASGYEFVEWSDTSTDNPRQDTGVSGTLTVTATFALI